MIFIKPLIVKSRIFKKKFGKLVLLTLVIILITLCYFFLELNQLLTKKSTTISYKQKLDQEIGIPLQKKLNLIHKLHNPKRLKIGYKYFDEIFNHIFEAKPKVNELNSYLDQKFQSERYDLKTEGNMFSESYLNKFLQISANDLVSMKQSHKYIIDNLPNDYPKNLYNGNGIVYVGGGQFNWLTLLSIRNLRQLGSKLPVEVLIPKLDEFELELCGNIFPKLNAKCIYMPYVLPKSIYEKFKFKGYQYKVLAILLSSFQNVLLLDSDNIPVKNPDNLFVSNPFISKGLIVWPDFWKRSTSPAYYSIAGLNPSKSEFLPKYSEAEGKYLPQDLPKSLDLDHIPLHERKFTIPDPTSESGQLMISKKSHMKPLLLSLYYNIYGPNHYYPLFLQGASGEGDKETFLAATIVTNNQFYQVGQFLNAFGHFDSKNEFVGTGMGQFDPVQDYLHSTKDGDPPEIMFVHANFPKLNPWGLKLDKKIVDENGNRVRIYGTGMAKRVGFDFELVQWQNSKYLLCDLNIKLATFEHVNHKDMCEELSTHIDFLNSTQSTLEGEFER